MKVWGQPLPLDKLKEMQGQGFNLVILRKCLALLAEFGGKGE
jgi:hypothetical protein